MPIILWRTLWTIPRDSRNRSKQLNKRWMLYAICKQCNSVMMWCVFRDVLEQLSEMEKSGGISPTGRKQCCSIPVNQFTFKQDWLLSCCSPLFSWTINRQAKLSNKLTWLFKCKWTNCRKTFKCFWMINFNAPEPSKSRLLRLEKFVPF